METHEVRKALHNYLLDQTIYIGKQWDYEYYVII